MSPKIHICVLLIMAAATAVFAESLPARNAAKQPRNREISLARRRFFQEETGEETGLEEDSKRVAPALIIAGASLAVSTLTTLVTTITNVDRKIAIGIDNESDHQWKAKNVYFFSGTSDNTLPDVVKHGEALVYTSRKTAGTAKGAVGVLAYFIPSRQSTVMVMFSVPWDYNLYSNWWNAQCYKGEQKAEYKYYKDQYYDAYPKKGDNGWHDVWGSNGFHAKGSMSSAGGATLLVKILKVC